MQDNNKTKHTLVYPVTWNCLTALSLLLTLTFGKPFYKFIPLINQADFQLVNEPIKEVNRFLLSWQVQLAHIKVWWRSLEEGMSKMKYHPFSSVQPLNLLNCLWNCSLTSSPGYPIAIRKNTAVTVKRPLYRAIKLQEVLSNKGLFQEASLEAQFLSQEKKIVPCCIPNTTPRNKCKHRCWDRANVGIC